jgi:peptide/nickel transport system permease protein
MGLAIPRFWIATMTLVFLSIWFHWSPPFDYVPFNKDPRHNLLQFLIPSIILGFSLSASTMRMTRSAMLEVLREDYIRTAWAKGLQERVVITRHALKNAFIPVVTVVGSQVGHLLGGAVVVELIFGLPGMGRLTLDSIIHRDYTQIQVNVVLIGAVMVFMNLLVDISYAWLDPRIRLGKS